MKETPLINIHKNLKAVMVNFAGYAMPVYYSSAIEEHKTVRNKLGIFDVSHMGQFIVEGKEAYNFLQEITTNDVSKLSIGQAQYSLLLNKDGGVIDDLILYRLDENKYMLVVNAANIDKDYNWITNFEANVDIQNISDQTALIALQGPLAEKALQKITEINLSEIKYYSFKIGSIAGINDIIISATGYTGAGGFELYVKNEQAENLWNAIISAGDEYGILPAGLASRDSLRLEKAYCLYGNEIAENTNPLEAGLSWVIKFNKNFIGKGTLLKSKEAGLTSKLVGLTSTDKLIPRKGSFVIDENNNKKGIITSGGFSPMLNKPIAMAYLDKGVIANNSQLFVDIRNKKINLSISKLPFV